jgi:hypothetical protein
MNEQQQVMFGCAGFSLALTLFVYNSVMTYFVLYVPIIPGYIMSFITSLGVFESLFWLSTNCYSRFLFKYVSPDRAIKGHWYHVTKIEKPVREVRYGEVSMRNWLGSVRVNGINKDENDDYRSRFYSLATYCDGLQLLIFYQSEGHKRKRDRIRNGMMELEMVPGEGHFHRPCMLVGSWKDTVPSPYSGSITFFLRKEEWEEETKREIENIRKERLRHANHTLPSKPSSE